MTEAYPILEILRLTTLRHKTIPPDHQPILSALRFPNLTFLSLSNFQLRDGSALLPVKLKPFLISHSCLLYCYHFFYFKIIKGCPKLKIVHMKTDALDSSSFPSNLELFLRQADKLRDFRYYSYLFFPLYWYFTILMTLFSIC